MHRMGREKSKINSKRFIPDILASKLVRSGGYRKMKDKNYWFTLLGSSSNLSSCLSIFKQVCLKGKRTQTSPDYN